MSELKGVTGNATMSETQEPIIKKSRRYGVWLLLLIGMSGALFAWGHQRLDFFQRQRTDEFRTMLKESEDKTTAMLQLVRGVQMDLSDLHKTVQSLPSREGTSQTSVLYVALTYYARAQTQWVDQHHPHAARDTLLQLQQWLSALPATPINAELQHLLVQDLNQCVPSGSSDQDVLMTLQQLQDQLSRQSLETLRLKAHTVKVALPSIQLPSTHWEKLWAESRQLFGNLISIRHEVKNEKTWIPLSDSQWLQQNLILELQKAQLAGLSHQKSLMQASLQRCVTLLEEGLEPSLEQQQWLMQLNNVQKTLRQSEPEQYAQWPLSSSMTRVLQWISSTSRTE